jgi:hypothetical protein
METEFIIQLTIQMIRILIAIYGSDVSNYNPYTDIFMLTNQKEQIILIADFAGADEIIVCDNEFYNKCGFKNKQKIILLGQTQVLLELDSYPMQVPDRIYIHPTHKGKPIHLTGYKMDMGFIYNRVHELQ